MGVHSLFLTFFFITSERRGLGKSLAINTMTTNAMSEPTPLLSYNDVLGPDTPYNSSDDEPLVPVREKVKPVKRERSATATVEPDTKKAMHVKRERSASAPAEPEPAYKAAREREDPINKMYDRVTAPNSPGNKASVATPPSSPGTANDDDVPRDPRLVAKQAKFTPEKASFTITSASPVTSPSRASTTRCRIPVPTTRSRMRTLKRQDTRHRRCKLLHCGSLRRLCMQQPCFQIERIRVMHRRCMLQESSNRSSLGLPCSHVDKHKHTRKHKRKYTPTHTPTPTHTEPFPSSSPFPARCWVCYLALLGLFRATPQ